MADDGKWSLRLGRCAGYAADGAVACARWATWLGLVLGGTRIRWLLLGFRIGASHWQWLMPSSSGGIISGPGMERRDSARRCESFCSVFLCFCRAYVMEF